MKQTINLDTFIHNPALKNNFSYDGLVALFNYLEDYEESCGVELDFDPIAIRCEFTEYADLDNISQNYIELNDDFAEDDDEGKMEWLTDRTTVIEFDGGIILQDF